jgi:hypothetical protein
MRDPLGIHARRIRRALTGHLQPDDTVQAFARDDALREYWVLTTRDLFQLHGGGAPLTRVALADIVGSVTHSSVGINVRIRSRQPNSRPLLASFSTPNEVTRRLVDLLEPRPAGE